MAIVIRVQRKTGGHHSGEELYEDVDEFSFSTEEEADEFVERIRDVVPD